MSGGLTGIGAAATVEPPPALLASVFALVQVLQGRPGLLGSILRLERFGPGNDRWVCETGAGEQRLTRPEKPKPSPEHDTPA